MQFPTTTLFTLFAMGITVSGVLRSQCAYPVLLPEVLPEVRAAAAAARDNFGNICLLGGNLDGAIAPNPAATATVRRFREINGQLVDTTNTAPVMPPMQHARGEHGAASDRYGRICVFGGAVEGQPAPLTSCERYDPRTNLWTSIAPLPAGRSYCRAVASLDGMSIFVLGGQSASGNSTNTVFRFDVASGTWSTDSPMLFEHVVHGAVMGKDGTVYAVAGTGPLGQTKLEARNPWTGLWSELPAAPIFVEQAAACYTDGLGRVHLMSAYQGGGWQTETSHQVYDPALGSWAACSPFNPPTNNMAAVTSDTGRIYLLGGQSGFARLDTIRAANSEALRLTTTQYSGPGSVDVRIANGTPGELAVTVISLNPANNSIGGLGGLGTGWWGGLHASLQDVWNSLGAGAPPLWMYLDGTGASTWSLPAGSLSFLFGFTFFCNTHSFDPASLTVSGVSYPTALTLR